METTTNPTTWKISETGMATSSELPGLVVFIAGGRRGSWTVGARTTTRRGPIVTALGTKQDACTAAAIAFGQTA